MNLNIQENKKRVRFNIEDDIILLREVVSTNPYEDTSRWVIIQENVNEKSRKMFTIRTIKEHLELILKKFVIKDEKNIKTTGTEEDYSEYHHLLQQIAELSKDDTNKNGEANKSSSYYAKACLEKGKAIRRTLLENFKANGESDVQKDGSHIAFVTNSADQYLIENNNGMLEPEASHSNEKSTALLDECAGPSNSVVVNSTPRSIQTSKNKELSKNVATPNRSRQPKRLKNSALEYLQGKAERDTLVKIKDQELESRRIQIEERKIQLEEKKLTHQIDMDKKKLELEAIRLKIEQGERKKVHEIVENYQRMLDSFLKKNLF